MDAKSWNNVKDELLHGYIGTVILKIDGYEIHLVKTHISELREAIWVFINGVDGTKFAISDDEDSQEIKKRFFCCKTKNLFNQKKLANAPKKVKAAILADKDKYTYEYFLPYWTSFDKMKRHFKKNNTSIEIERVGLNVSTEET